MSDKINTVICAKPMMQTCAQASLNHNLCAERAQTAKEKHAITNSGQIPKICSVAEL